MPDIRIGISGWTYEPWRGVFYPPKLPHARELEFASRQLNSIEINGSFYSLQSPASYRKWFDATPDDFVFSLKGGRFITHLRRLRDVRIPLANFFASGVLLLREKLGPILWQFPPNFKFDAERFETFFKLLPRSTGSASRLAAEHQIARKDRVDIAAGPDRPMRYAVEVRHESFQSPEFVKLCRAHDVAIVCADSAGKWPYFEAPASDFAYVRLHGAEELYVGGYTDAALDEWAKRIRKWSQKPSRDVFVYFDNDVKVRSPMDAISLSRRLGLRVGTMDPTLLKAVEQEEARPSWPAVKRRRRSTKKS